MNILTILFDWVGKAFVLWLKEIRAEQALRDLGRVTAEQDALRKAEADETRARNAADRHVAGGVPDPRDRANRRTVEDR